MLQLEDIRDRIARKWKGLVNARKSPLTTEMLSDVLLGIQSLMQARIHLRQLEELWEDLDPEQTISPEFQETSDKLRLKIESLLEQANEAIYYVHQYKY